MLPHRGVATVGRLDAGLGIVEARRAAGADGGPGRGLAISGGRLQSRVFALVAHAVGGGFVGVEVLAARVERLVGAAQAVFGQLALESDRRVGLFALGRRRRIGLRRRNLQQRIALELFGDELRKLEIGHLQHLDGLLQLGRHHQLLALSQIELLRERHGCSVYCARET